VPGPETIAKHYGLASGQAELMGGGS
jgi:hypothetical protein